jgi:hypothetical protein
MEQREEKRGTALRFHSSPRLRIETPHSHGISRREIRGLLSDLSNEITQCPNQKRQRMDDTYGSEYPGENLENEVLGHSFLSYPVGIRGDAQVIAAFQDLRLGDASANGCQHNLNTSCLDQPKRGRLGKVEKTSQTVPVKP